MTKFEKQPNPKKDQHFMIDHEMIEYICRKANIAEGESVVEIGGGAGALTEVLAAKGNPLTVIELDHYYAELLKEKFKDFSNVTIVEGNALNQNYLSYDRIVANLPYTITEPLLVNLAKTGALYKNNKDKKSSNVKSITLVVSQNSTRKMVAPIQVTEGKSRHFNLEFGFISAICQTYLEVEIDQVIPSSAFYPEPAVTSFLVNLTLKKKKTTVDRIMAEILMDRMDRQVTIGKIYQLMLLNGEIYKLNKHKTTQTRYQTTDFTSEVIKNSYVYDLTNAQISQLIKDLIRNDSNMKSLRKANNNRHYVEDSYEYYMRTGRYDDYDYDYYDEEYDDYDYYDEEYDDYDYYDDEYDDYDENSYQVVTKWQKKAENTYSYLYDESRYNALLHRGLEFIEKEELKKMLELS